MELVRRLLNATLDAYARVVDWSGNVVQRLAGAFEVQLSTMTAQFIGGLFVVFLLIFLLQWALWGGGFRMFRPQAVMHLTNRTPFQIVMEDLTGCLVRLIALALLLLLAVFLLGGTGTPWISQ